MSGWSVECDVVWQLVQFSKNFHLELCTGSDQQEGSSVLLGYLLINQELSVSMCGPDLIISFPKEVTGAFSESWEVHIVIRLLV